MGCTFFTETAIFLSLGDEPPHSCSFCYPSLSLSKLQTAFDLHFFMFWKDGVYCLLPQQSFSLSYKLPCTCTRMGKEIITSHVVSIRLFWKVGLFFQNLKEMLRSDWMWMNLKKWKFCRKEIVQGREVIMSPKREKKNEKKMWGGRWKGYKNKRVGEIGSYRCCFIVCENDGLRAECKAA